MATITALEHARREYSGSRTLIDLTASSFRDFGCALPESVYARIWQRWREKPAYVPSGRGGSDARHAVCELLAGAIEPENVILTSGTSVSYLLLFGMLARRGGCVALPRPGYPLFEELASLAGISTTSYLTRRTDGWLPNPEALVADLGSDVSALVLITPNNPCGVAYPKPLVEQIVRLAAERQIMVVIDEVFARFGPSQRPLPALATPSGVPVVRLDGLSKRYAAPEIKAGWIAIEGPGAAELAEELDTHHDLMLTLSGYAEAAVATLVHDDEAANAQEAWSVRIAAARAAMRAGLGGVDGIEVSGGQAGIHGIVTIDGSAAQRMFGSDDDEEVAVALVEQYGLYMHPGYLYGIDESVAAGGPSVVATALQTDDSWAEVARRLASMAGR